MAEQCYEVDEKEIAPQDYRERARAVSGKRCDRSEARCTANHARTSLDATVHVPSTTLLSTVERMETEVGLPPDEPKSHFLDGKGNLFRSEVHHHCMCYSVTESSRVGNGDDTLETSHSPFSVPFRPWAFGAAVLLDPYSVNELRLDGLFGSR